MPEIVTLEEVKLWLRVDSDHEDISLALMIAAATESVLAVADAYDSESEVPAGLKLAVLAHVTRAFESRDAVDAPEGNLRLVQRLRTLEV